MLLSQVPKIASRMETLQGMIGAPASSLLWLTIRDAVVWGVVHFTLLAIVRKLKHIEAKIRGEWANRVIGSLHAAIVGIFCTRALFVEEPFSTYLPARWLGNSVNYFAGHSNTLDYILPISLGYFCYDMVILTFSTNNPDAADVGVLMFVHHIGSLIIWPIAYVNNTHHIYLLYLLATELSTPFLHQTTFFLPKAGLADTAFHKFNGVMLILIFFFLRVCTVPIMAWSLFDASEYFYQLATVFQFLTVISLPIPAALNLFWFLQMIQQALSIARDSTTEGSVDHISNGNRKLSKKSKQR